jgi:chemotaxis methyl-accepting protein methylase
MSTTTRFFRNYPQLVTVADTMRTLWEPGCRLDVLHVGGSIGCEALSFMVVVNERQAGYQLRVVSTDVDARALEHGRGLAYDEELFAPILGEGGGRPDLVEKWFVAGGAGGRRVYCPDPRLSRQLTFAVLDIGAPPPGLTADVVFCQNVLIHMSRPLAERCLRNVLGLLRSPAILVCAGMDLDLRTLLGGAGLRPIAEGVREIHEAWASHRVHFQRDRGRYYFELEDLDESRPDWVARYSSIFVKDHPCA